MGILAFQIVWFITMWRQLAGPLKYIYAIYLTIITGTMLFGGFYKTGSDVDAWGHIGGFLIGLCFTLVFYPPASGSLKIRLPAAILLLVFLALPVGLSIVRNTNM